MRTYVLKFYSIIDNFGRVGKYKAFLIADQKDFPAFSTGEEDKARPLAA